MICIQGQAFIHCLCLIIMIKINFKHSFSVVLLLIFYIFNDLTFAIKESWIHINYIWSNWEDGKIYSGNPSISKLSKTSIKVNVCVVGRCEAASNYRFYHTGQKKWAILSPGGIPTEGRVREWVAVADTATLNTTEPWAPYKAGRWWATTSGLLHSPTRLGQNYTHSGREAEGRDSGHVHRCTAVVFHQHVHLACLTHYHNRNTSRLVCVRDR